MRFGQYYEMETLKELGRFIENDLIRQSVKQEAGPLLALIEYSSNRAMEIRRGYLQIQSGQGSDHFFLERWIMSAGRFMKDLRGWVFKEKETNATLCKYYVTLSRNKMLRWYHMPSVDDEKAQKARSTPLHPRVCPKGHELRPDIQTKSSDLPDEWYVCYDCRRKIGAGEEIYTCKICSEESQRQTASTRYYIHRSCVQMNWWSGDDVRIEKECVCLQEKKDDEGNITGCDHVLSVGIEGTIVAVHPSGEPSVKIKLNGTCAFEADSSISLGETLCVWIQESNWHNITVTRGVIPAEKTIDHSNAVGILDLQNTVLEEPGKSSDPNDEESRAFFVVFPQSSFHVRCCEWNADPNDMNNEVGRSTTEKIHHRFRHIRFQCKSKAACVDWCNHIKMILAEDRTQARRKYSMVEMKRIGTRRGQFLAAGLPASPVEQSDEIMRTTSLVGRMEVGEIQNTIRSWSPPADLSPRVRSSGKTDFTPTNATHTPFLAPSPGSKQATQTHQVEIQPTRPQPRLGFKFTTEV